MRTRRLSKNKRPSQEGYFISNRERLRLHRRAYRAQQLDHSEICGALIVDGKRCITFLFLKNYSTQPGRYELRLSDIRSARTSVSHSARRIIGTFHSHPLSEARPSLGDRKRGFYRGIELIYDVCGREIKLWQQKHQGKRTVLRELPLVLGKKNRRT